MQLAHQISSRAILSSRRPSQRRRAHTCELAAWKLAVSIGGLSTHHSKTTRHRHTLFVVQVQPAAFGHDSLGMVAMVIQGLPRVRWLATFTGSDDRAPVTSQPKGQDRAMTEAARSLVLMAHPVWSLWTILHNLELQRARSWACRPKDHTIQAYQVHSHP